MWNESRKEGAVGLISGITNWLAAVGISLLLLSFGAWHANLQALGCYAVVFLI